MFLVFRFIRHVLENIVTKPNLNKLLSVKSVLFEHVAFFKQLLDM